MSDEKKVVSFDEFTTDESKVDGGVWFPYKTARLLIASTDKRAFVNAMDLLNAKYPNRGALQSPEADELFQDILARHILLGWEGFGEPYSQKTAKEKLKIKAFRELVYGIASKYENFRPDETPVIKN